MSPRRHGDAFANSGSLTLWLDDAQKQSLTFIDNDTRPLTEVRLGAQSIETGTRGTLYFDDFESRRFSYIGTLTDPGVDDPTATNQAGWFGRTYQYSATIPHAVTSVNPETGSPDTYSYDANGSMTCRVEGGVTYSQAYNAENRISSIAKRTGDCATGTILESWSFAYDGDGVRVMTAHFTGTSGTPDSTTSYFMGGQFEVKDGTTKKYYSIAGMMVAVNDGTGLQYLLTDHLGSTVAVTNSSGTLTSQQRYLPFGAPRTIPNSPILGTDFTYTGQRKLDDDMGGIMDYKARFYSPALGRFIQPDSVVPDPSGSQGWNRYSYALNNPIRYNDPTGHCAEPLTFILCAAVIGAVVSVAVDAIVTTQVKNERYSWEQAGQAALTGAVAGAVGAAVGVVGAAIAGTSLAATVVTGAIAGVASGQATRAVTNKLNNRPITEGLFDPMDMATDAVLGGAMAGVGWGIGKYAKSLNGACSFTEDTLVATEEGEKAISAIVVGDYVLAWNEANETLGYYEVTDTFSHEDKVLTELIVDGEWIETTPEHPFYVEGKGWTPADELRTGDRIRQGNGTAGRVWLKWNVHKTQEMYNLTVDTAHTFFVGESQWLVHNACRPKDLAYRYLGDDEATLIQNNGGVIPNTNRLGYPKQVSTSPNYYETIEGAEEGLLLGRLDPGGPQMPPTYRATYLRNSVQYQYTGNSQTGSGVEMLTSQAIKILRLDKLIPR